jgi:hypothetical protein
MSNNNGFNNQAEDEAPKLDGRKFIGEVVENRDPKKKQRIKGITICCLGSAPLFTLDSV